MHINRNLIIIWYNRHSQIVNAYDQFLYSSLLNISGMALGIEIFERQTSSHEPLNCTLVLCHMLGQAYTPLQRRNHQTWMWDDSVSFLSPFSLGASEPRPPTAWRYILLNWKLCIRVTVQFPVWCSGLFWVGCGDGLSTELSFRKSGVHCLSSFL